MSKSNSRSLHTAGKNKAQRLLHVQIANEAQRGIAFHIAKVYLAGKTLALSEARPFVRRIARVRLRLENVCVFPLTQVCLPEMPK